MKRRGRAAAIAGVALFVIAFGAALIALAPASLLGAALERATGGRLTVAGSSGRIWSGRGTLLAVNDPARVLLRWKISPWRLVAAEVAGELRIGAAEPVSFIATRQRLALERFDVVLPAALIAAALGPYDGYKIGGAVRMRGERAAIDRSGGTGRTSIDWSDAASGLIDISPLGSYSAELEATAQAGSMTVRTKSGPLLLEGTGRWSAGGAAVQLTARASGDRADTLKAWLRTMTPEQADGSFRFAWPQAAAPQRGPRS